MYNDFIDIKHMTILIFVLIAFGIMNIIHHITMIEQLKAVKRNQSDIIEYLDGVDDDMAIVYEELKDIKQSIETYTNRNQWLLSQFLS